MSLHRADLSSSSLKDNDSAVPVSSWLVDASRSSSPEAVTGPPPKTTVTEAEATGSHHVSVASSPLANVSENAASLHSQKTGGSATLGIPAVPVVVPSAHRSSSPLPSSVTAANSTPLNVRVVTLKREIASSDDEDEATASASLNKGDPVRLVWGEFGLRLAPIPAHFGVSSFFCVVCACF